MVLFPVDNFTLHTLRTAEFGFLGFVVYILAHTALRCGAASSKGDETEGLPRTWPGRSFRHPRITIGDMSAIDSLCSPWSTVADLVALLPCLMGWMRMTGG